MKDLQASVAEIGETGFNNCHVGASLVTALWKSDREKPLLKMSYDISAAVRQKARGRL